VTAVAAEPGVQVAHVGAGTEAAPSRTGASAATAACELQRDWARQETVSAIVEIVLFDRLLRE
jgi:hypothetical protein